MNAKMNEIIFLLLLCCFISSCAKKRTDELSLLLDDKPYDYADFELAEL